ncbi:MAG: DUF86 domain-containing protein [Candidatus Aureabacteria bacterium]|nr:DUF86 domain-containing protein [Candidatus Auribacterota bacterium]
MQHNSNDPACLWDMLDAALAVQRFVEGKSVQDYLGDRMLRGAVERHVEIIGEASSKVSQVFRDSHPEVPWKRIVAQRNVLAHNYGEIKHELMWKVATQRIPELIVSLQPMLPVLPTDRET